MSRSKKRIPFSVDCEGTRVIVLARHEKGAKSVAQDHGYTLRKDSLDAVLRCAPGAAKHAINADRAAAE